MRSIRHHHHHTSSPRRRSRPQTRLFHRRISGPSWPVQVPDAVVARVRAAGGPTDEACYSCACGYVFSAAVSTSVTCPHCSSEQAW
jgi:hypothetical protein